MHLFRTYLGIPINVGSRIDLVTKVVILASDYWTQKILYPTQSAFKPPLYLKSLTLKNKFRVSVYIKFSKLHQN